MEMAQIIDITPELEKKASTDIALIVAAPVKVVDGETMKLATIEVERADAAFKKIEDDWGGYRDAANKAHKGWTHLINDILKPPIQKYRDFHVAEVKTFQRAERDRIEAAQIKLEMEARKKAEEEKLREAEEAAKSGDKDAMKIADAILDEPIEVQVPIVKSEAPKVDQRKYRTVWKARVTDRSALIVFVAGMIVRGAELNKEGKRAESSAYSEYVEAFDINQGWLNKKANANGKNFSMPGCVGYED